MNNEIPRHIVWSTDHIDTNDPFQRRWLLRQILMYGRAEDIQKVDIVEVEKQLDNLHLNPVVERLWRAYFAWRHSGR